VTEVARRWQVSPQQVFDWRRQARQALAEATAPGRPSFMPVVPELPAPVLEAVAAVARLAPSIEVKLAGAVVHIAPGTQRRSIHHQHVSQVFILCRPSTLIRCCRSYFSGRTKCCYRER
jgi:transposase-like protein